MVIVLGEFRMPEQSRADAVAAMERVVTATRAESGCIAYWYAEDVSEPGLFRVSEQWSSHAALAAHFTVPHMIVWQQERAALGMTGRMVTAYTASDAVAL